MNRLLKTFTGYCPHAPRSLTHGFGVGPCWVGRHFSIHLRDFQSTLDGTVAYAILFSLLFFCSFANAPAAGLAEVYRDSLLRTGLATAVALAVIAVYVRFVTKKVFSFRLVNAKKSLFESFFALSVWVFLWVFFGQLSGTYHLASEQTRVGLAPLALCVGLLDGVLVYAYCVERFVTGVGRTVGIFISSVFGWLLFLAASVDFALYLFPVVLVLAYVSVKAGSPLGPILATGLLMAFFCTYFGVSPWILASRQVGYWLMTVVSVASAFVAQSTVAKLPFEGRSYEGNRRI